ncbi:hypothetical protein TNCV_2209081, partial [Trichonephila clavipes]
MPLPFPYGCPLPVRDTIDLLVMNNGKNLQSAKTEKEKRIRELKENPPEPKLA